MIGKKEFLRVVLSARTIRLPSTLAGAPRRAASLGALAVCLLVGCAKAPVDQLIADLQSGDSDKRYEATKALADYGPQAAPAAPLLATALSDPDPKLRLRSVKALSKLGVAAHVAVAEVAQCLDDADVETRYYAVKTLSRLDDAALPALERLTALLHDDPDPRVRYYAAKTLGKIGQEAHPAVAVLKYALRDKDANVRRAAGEALAKVNPPS